jgi:hypothetical protein
MDSPDMPRAPEKTLPVEAIFTQCLKWHDEFDRTVWQGRESYHNRHHVMASCTAADLIIESVINGEEDVLGIKQDLEKWNLEHTGDNWTLEEFRGAVKNAFAAHDLGNVAEKMIVKNGKPELVFLKKYTAVGAEERSVEIAGSIIDAEEMSLAQKVRYKELVKHLVKETTIDYGDQAAMFRVLMRVSDQIGGHLLTTQKNGQLGLLREIITENPEAAKGFDYEALGRFFRYPVRRFPELLPFSDAQQHLVKNVWKRKEEFDKNKKPFTDGEAVAARKFMRRVSIENTLERSRLRKPEQS